MGFGAKHHGEPQGENTYDIKWWKKKKTDVP